MIEWRRFSRLPRSPEYWRGVSDRVAQSVHAMAAPDVEPVRSLAPYAWTAIAAAVVAVVASSVLPVRTDAPVSIRAGIAPTDPIATTWLNTAEPPSAADVLVGSMTGAR
jgi:hypothetical protein